VKKLLQITGLISMTLLYCFATAFCSGMALRSDAIFSKTNRAEKESYSQSVSAKSFQHTVQTENSVTVCSHHSPVTVKNTYKEFSAANKAVEHVSVHTFSQYNFFSHKLLARLQNTDLIFPFHYFW
jgi:hypothetical protein